MAHLEHVTIYTDGACIGNPGAGGYGVVLLYESHREEFSGGFRRTTNNRMEILAAIKGLESLKDNCRVTVYSDSQYVVNAIEQGWAKRWRNNGWQRSKTTNSPAKNPDLWGKLLMLTDRHEVTFEWVPGHAGIAENERCDRLAVEAAHRPDLPPDYGYQPGRALL